MIFGSIESAQDEVRALLKGDDTKGVNMVEIASKLFNKGRPGVFEVIGLELPEGAQFRFSPDVPWSTIPSTGYLNFAAMPGARALVGYLEIDGADTFNIYFGMN